MSSADDDESSSGPISDDEMNSLSEAVDVMKSLFVPSDQEEEEEEDAAPSHEFLSIDINGCRHEIISQVLDETGQPVVVLKNVETGDHVALPFSALYSDPEAVPDPHP